MYYGLLCALLKHSVLASVGMMRMRWLDHCSVLKRQFCVLVFKGGQSWVMFNEAEGKNSCPWKLCLQGLTSLFVPHLPPVWNSQKSNAWWRRIAAPLQKRWCKMMLKEVEDFPVVLWVTDTGLNKSVSFTLPAVIRLPAQKKARFCFSLNNCSWFPSPVYLNAGYILMAHWHI